MRKMITRKMVTSKVYGFKLLIKDGNPDVIKLEPITVGGKVSDIEGLKALKNHYGKTLPIMVEKIEQFEDVYEISVDDFLKYATKVSKSEKGNTSIEDEKSDDKKDVPFKPEKSKTVESSKIGVKPATK